MSYADQRSSQVDPGPTGLRMRIHSLRNEHHRSGQHAPALHRRSCTVKQEPCTGVQGPTGRQRDNRAKRDGCSPVTGDGGARKGGDRHRGTSRPSAAPAAESMRHETDLILKPLRPGQGGVAPVVVAGPGVDPYKRCGALRDRSRGVGASGGRRPCRRPCARAARRSTARPGPRIPRLVGAWCPGVAWPIGVKLSAHLLVVAVTE